MIKLNNLNYSLKLHRVKAMYSKMIYEPLDMSDTMNKFE